MDLFQCLFKSTIWRTDENLFDELRMRKMKVLIDAQPLIGTRTGIGKYVEQLSLNLENKNIKTNYWFNQILKNKHKYLGLNDRNIINSRYPYKAIRRLFSPNVLYDIPIDINKKIDLFHGTNFITYNTLKVKNIITIHDLAFLKFPYTADDKTFRHHKEWLPYSIEKADHIIAVSNQTKKDIIELFKVKDNKITTIHLSADKNMKKQNGIVVNDVRIKYGLPHKYLLFVGTVEPRKNLEYMLKAFLLSKMEINHSYKLVIVGKIGWKYERLHEFINHNNLEKDITFLGYVDGDDLPAIYSGATIFLYSSLYEGFGIPLLEAMNCGVPVITSNTSCIPEVVGEAAIQVPIDDVSNFSRQINNVILSEALQNELSIKSLERASRFSWENVATETIQVYEKVLNGE